MSYRKQGCNLPQARGGGATSTFMVQYGSFFTLLKCKKVEDQTYISVGNLIFFSIFFSGIIYIFFNEDIKKGIFNF